MGEAKVLREKATELFNIDEIIFISPVFLMEMDESGWVFFIPHLPPHQGKTFEAGEEILHGYENRLQQLL